MSVKYSLLALLAEKPRHGYDLKSEFEIRTQHSWPLNIGQVYTTLDRLERDGLVTREKTNSDGRIIYTLTAQGKTAVNDWFTSPIISPIPNRDELVIKLAIAVTLPNIDVETIIQTQRRSQMENLQNLNRLRRQTGNTDLPGQLIIDNLIFQAEAQIRWLDHCEASVSQKSDQAPKPKPTLPMRHLALIDKE